MTDTPTRADLIERLDALSAKATQGTWEIDSVYDPDALATSGGGCTRGFHDFEVIADGRSRPVRLFDSINADDKLIEDDRHDLDGSAWDAVGRANLEFVVALVNAYRSGQLATRAPTADAERIAALEGEVERLRIAEVAANQRAAQAEYRLYSFRQSRASTSKALAEFIKARAPDLWPDYAAVSVNKSVYSDDYVQEPTWEREMNILRHRAEKAEDEATTLRAALKGTDHDPA